jgi:hypothetical protein
MWNLSPSDLPAGGSALGDRDPDTSEILSHSARLCRRSAAKEKAHVEVLDGLTDLLAMRGLEMLVTAPDLL